MCGLVGVAGKLEAKDEQTMKRLLAFDYFRGPDSTGMAGIRNTREVKLSKISDHPFNLFEMPSFKTALSGYNSTVFLGHNRAATKGCVNSFNAHPFHVDHIVGAHNGTLSTASHEALEKLLGDKYPVDSLAIITAIARHGITETVKLLQGAWALVWYDQTDNSLNFLRNKERPLWYGYTKNFDRLFWASEWPVADCATRLSAQSYDMHSTDGVGPTYFSFEENIHYRFDIDELKKGSTGYKPKVKELKGKEPAPVTTSTGYNPFPARDGTSSSNGGSGNTGGGQTPTNRRTGTHSTTYPSQCDRDKRIDTLYLIGDVKDPFGGYYTEKQFKDLAGGGCQFCQGPIGFGDTGLVIFERDDMILCPNCCLAGDSNRVFVKNMDILI